MRQQIYDLGKVVALFAALVMLVAGGFYIVNLPTEADVQQIIEESRPGSASASLSGAQTSQQLGSCEDIESREPLDELSQAVWPSVIRVESVSDEGDVKISSGFVYKVEGQAAHILTSWHGLYQRGTVMVCTYDGSRYVIDRFRVDKENDMATLTLVGRPDLEPLPVSSAAALNYGQRVLIAGYPEGSVWKFQTVYGEVGASTHCGPGFFVINDAFLSPVGNSGGPIVSRDGEVVGVLMRYVDSDDGRFFCASAVPSAAIR